MFVVRRTKQDTSQCMSVVKAVHDEYRGERYGWEEGQNNSPITVNHSIRAEQIWAASDNFELHSDSVVSTLHCEALRPF
jgi:hypothetical protein